MVSLKSGAPGPNLKILADHLCHSSPERYIDKGSLLMFLALVIGEGVVERQAHLDDCYVFRCVTDLEIADTDKKTLLTDISFWRRSYALTSRPDSRVCL